jgi:hypothetical protein
MVDYRAVAHRLNKSVPLTNQGLIQREDVSLFHLSWLNNPEGAQNKENKPDVLVTPVLMGEGIHRRLRDCVPHSVGKFTRHESTTIFT